MSAVLHRRLDKLRQPDAVRERRLLLVDPNETEDQAMARHGFDLDGAGIEYLVIRFIEPEHQEDGGGAQE